MSTARKNRALVQHVQQGLQVVVLFPQSRAISALHVTKNSDLLIRDSSKNSPHQLFHFIKLR